MNDDIQEIKDDVKEIKKMLSDHIIEEALLKQTIKFHSKLWNGTIIGAIGIVGFLMQDWFKNVFRH